MKVTRIKFFLFFSVGKISKFYTFKISDYNTIYFKKLQNNKIFYNNFIYDQDFFYHDKFNRLNDFVENCRQQYIDDKFLTIAKLASAKNLPLRVICFDPKLKNEWTHLTFDQFNVLVEAYKHEFLYMPNIYNTYEFYHEDITLDVAELMMLGGYKNHPPFQYTIFKNLITEDVLYRIGWKSIKPIYAPFKRAIYQDYNDRDAVYFDVAKDTDSKRPWFTYNYYNEYSPNSLLGQQKPDKILKLGDEIRFIWDSLNLEERGFFFIAETEPRFNRAFVFETDRVVRYDTEKYYNHYNNELIFLYKKYNKISSEESINSSELFYWYYNVFKETQDFIALEDKMNNEMKKILEKREMDYPKSEVYIREMTPKEEEEDGIIVLLDDAFSFFESMWIELSDKNLHEDFYTENYRYNHDLFIQGTRIRKEWYEYDENKKYNEFNIRSLTNSYHMRYKYYNEVACKDYPEDKKFKTEQYYKFTEKEIDEDFKHMTEMIPGESMHTRWTRLTNHRLRSFLALNDFVDKIKIIERTYRLVSYDVNTTHDYNGFFEEGDADYETHEKIQTKIYELLNDPQYLTVMPILDIYFELYRFRGWSLEGGDKSFRTDLNTQSNYYLRADVLNFYYIYRLYTLSLEHQDIWNKIDFVPIHMYMDEFAEEIADDYEDYAQTIGLLIIFFIWYLLYTLYIGIYVFPFEDIIFLSPERAAIYSSSFQDYYNRRVYISRSRGRKSFERYHYNTSSMNYLVSRGRPRLRLRRFNLSIRKSSFKSLAIYPETFINEFKYKYFRSRNKGAFPDDYLEMIDSFLFDEDRYAGLIEADHRIRAYSVKKGFDWKLEGIEY